MLSNMAFYEKGIVVNESHSAASVHRSQPRLGRYEYN